VDHDQGRVEEDRRGVASDGASHCRGIQWRADANARRPLVAVREAIMAMSKEEMRNGLSQGRTLIQEEWADVEEILFVDELIAEGMATATSWEWKDEFQCKRRRTRGIRND